jgi:hypothetical protein
MGGLRRRARLRFRCATAVEGVRTFDCLFAERRPIVYELFEQLLVEQALE